MERFVLYAAPAGEPIIGSPRDVIAAGSWEEVHKAAQDKGLAWVPSDNVMGGYYRNEPGDAWFIDLACVDEKVIDKMSKSTSQRRFLVSSHLTTRTTNQAGQRPSLEFWRGNFRSSYGRCRVQVSLFPQCHFPLTVSNLPFIPRYNGGKFTSTVQTRTEQGQ